MSIMVYQFGLLPPTENEHVVRRQLRAAHDYRNDLVAVERGRRSALRAVDDASPAVQEAKAVVRAATRSDRRAALHALRQARRAAREEARDELLRIKVLDDAIRRDARALTPCYWGSYLGIEAAHIQSRAQPLYGDDGLTANDPAFVRGPRWLESFPAGDPRGDWWLAPGQLGVQLQGGLSTTDALGGADTRVRLELGPARRRGRRYGVLRMRVGSDGRDPIWASWPVKTHRDIPADADWKWVRVSVRPEGLREHWTVEITIELPARQIRAPASPGVLSVEWEWSALDDGSVRVARWCDDRGGAGEALLPARVANGIRKPSGIRAVRDILLNDARDRVAAAIRADARAPAFARAAALTMHLWRSPQRFRALCMRWRLSNEAGGEALALLDVWERRDDHLYRYEACARGEALRERREVYRLLARAWAGNYGTVLFSDQDLSREARWGDDSDVRFVAGVSELRQAVRYAFGDDAAVSARWRDGAAEEDERLWCERTRDAWIAGGARGDGRFAALKEKTTNAWAARRAKKRTPIAVAADRSQTEV